MNCMQPIFKSRVGRRETRTLAWATFFYMASKKELRSIQKQTDDEEFKKEIQAIIEYRFWKSWIDRLFN